MTTADPPHPIHPGTTPPPRRQFRLKDLARVIAVAAVFCALFRDELRQDPWELARYFGVIGIGPYAVTTLTVLLARAVSARLLAWGAARQDRAGRMVVRLGGNLMWLAFGSILVAWIVAWIVFGRRLLRWARI